MFVPEPGLVVHVEQYIKQKKKEDEETSNQSPMTRQRSTPVDVHGYSSLPSISQQHYSSNVPPPINEHHFTIGSMVVIPTQYGEPLRGVIMWIDTVPGKPGLIAGVELVSKYILVIYYCL